MLRIILPICSSLWHGSVGIITVRASISSDRGSMSLVTVRAFLVCSHFVRVHQGMRSPFAIEDLIPFSVGVAARLTSNHARHGLDELGRDLGCGHRIHHMCPTLVVGTVHQRRFEAKIVEMPRIRKNLLLLCPHRRHHLRQPVELGVKNGAMISDARAPFEAKGIKSSVRPVQ